MQKLKKFASYLNMIKYLTDTPVTIGTLIRYEPIIRLIVESSGVIGSITEVLPNGDGLAALLNIPLNQVTKSPASRKPRNVTELTYDAFVERGKDSDLLVSLDGPMIFPLNERKGFIDLLADHTKKFLVTSYPLEHCALDVDSFGLLTPQDTLSRDLAGNFSMGYSTSEMLPKNSVRKITEWNEPTLIHLMASYSNLVLASPILKAKILDWILESQVLSDSDPIYRKTFLYEVVP
ncbi:hypothetical protein [Sulfobacillus harzensis]|uniref:Uncharacterized protein n=1 Tax=Sulfobacillus harzensis TaxID=2729629 RepID=A0A7Y0Q1Z0_9FIRM|nr:hypothetical protein [Sulfobacillus harzensis]NMP21346.1 hypothetical protein [Sulfobacillus harzensis]